MMVDVFILTHNEAMNLPFALASVKGIARRVFIVDSGSTDGTCEIAQAAGATVVHHDWEGYAGQRNWALANLPFEAPWTLILDADESVTPELAREIEAFAARPPETVPHTAYYINRVLIFMGGQIRHCGYFPSWNLRLFKTGSARYEERSVHEHIIVPGTRGYLKNLLRHEDRRGLEHYIAKHNRYSTLEAQELYRHRGPWPGLGRFFRDRVARRRFIKYRVALKIGMPWLWRFVYMYVVRFGFLDREAGMSFCLFISSYEMMIRIKYQDLERSKGATLTQVGGLAIPEGGSQSRRADSEPVMTLQRIAPPPAKEFPNQLPGPIPRAAKSPARVEAKPRVVKARVIRSGAGMRQSSQWSLRQKVSRVLWSITEKTLFRLSPHNAYGWRRFLLKLFGATIGQGVNIRPSVHIEIPWNLEIGDHTVVGDFAILYCLGKVKLGRYVTISQYAHLCAGTHETNTRRMALLRPPITLGDDVWIAADAFVGPGVTIGSRTVLGARSSAFKDLPEEVIAVGSPALPVKRREFERK